MIGGGDALRRDAVDLVDDLGAALLKLLDLVGRGFLPRGEEVFLTVHQGSEVGALPCRLHQFLGEGQMVGVVAFRLEPAAPGEDFEELALDDGELRPE